MSRMRKVISFLLILSIAVLSMNGYTKEKAMAASSITISDKTLSLEVDHYKTLRIKGTSAKVTWSSSNNAVATVDSKGKVFAKASGTATITAKVAGKKLTCKLNVIYMKKDVVLQPDSKYTLTIYGAKGTPVYQSSNEKIATVTKKGVVTAKAPGKAVITAKVDGKTISSKITVIDLNHKDILLELGGATGFIKTLRINDYNGKITWSSSNTKIATVLSTGQVLAKGYGNATITATVAGKKLSCNVKVVKINTKEFTLKMGETKNLKIYGTDSEIIWSSSKNSVAKVSANGKVSTVAPGKATITGYVDGRRVTSTVYVVE
jgi:uncharacterized protein YjdB